MSAKKVLVLAGGSAVLVLATLTLLTRGSKAKSAALSARGRAMEELGACIARHSPPSKGVLVLCNPFSKGAGYLDPMRQYERAALSGLRKGLGRDHPIIAVFPEIRGEYFTNRQALFFPPECRTPLSFAIQPASVDQLAQAHPECRVIVSLVGLPYGVEELRIWSDKDPRCFALLLADLRVIGPPAKAMEAFEVGKLLAAVDHGDGSEPPLIITRDNVEAVLKSQPKALGY